MILSGPTRREERARGALPVPSGPARGRARIDPWRRRAIPPNIIRD